MRITVNVSEDMIYEGEPSRPSECPIALGILEVLPASKPCVIGPIRGVRLEVWGQKKVAKLPEIAADFIRGYDLGKEWFSPITFPLEIN